MDDKPPGDEDEDVDLLPSNPIERRDARIAELERDVAAMPALQEAVVKAKVELNNVKKSAQVAGSRVKFARKVTEEWLKDCLPDANFKDEHSKVLVSLMSSLYSFESDPESDKLKPKDDFLKDIEEGIAKNEDSVVMK